MKIAAKICVHENFASFYFHQFLFSQSENNYILSILVFKFQRSCFVFCACVVILCISRGKGITHFYTFLVVLYEKGL